MQRSAQDQFQFGRFQLDAAERRLLRDGSPVALPPKVFDLLVVLVQNHGRLMEKERLIEALWPGTFIEESNLTVNVSALRKALGDSAGLIETIPKKGYRFTGVVTSDTVPSDAPPASPAMPFARWIIGGASIVVAVAMATLWFAYWRRDRGVSDVRSIAILPFSTIAAPQSEEYLGLGMADAIITRIAGLNRIDVRPTSAITKYAGQHDAHDRVIRELHVDAVVEGRIQQIEKRVRVTVQLTRARDGKQLWADSFDDYFSNIFAVQDAIAEKIARVLAMKLSDSEQSAMTHRYTENTEAYRLYIQGQYLVSKRLNEATLNAIDYFEKAIAADPAYPLPYAALAHSSIIRAGEGFGPEFRQKARAAALKALDLAPTLADAHTALGEVMMRSDWDWTGAERAFRQALRLDPNSPMAHAALSTLHTAMGQHADAIAEMQIACRLDPASSSLRADLSWALHFARRHEEAVAEAKKALDLDAWSYSAHRQLSKAYLFTSRYPEAVAEAMRCLEIAGGRRRVLAELAAAEAAAGNSKKALQLVDESLHNKLDDPVAHYEIAVALARLGQRDRAFASLNTAVEQRLTRTAWIKTDPEMDPLRDDPRFAALLTKMGLAKAAP